MVQIVDEILRRDDDTTRLHLVYSCRSSDDILLRESVMNAARHWNFTFTLCVSQNVHLSLCLT